jgi:multiple antibiotic resistance protein
MGNGADVKNDLQAIATILSLVNPAMCAAIFAQIEKGQSGHARLLDATKSVLVVLIILIVAALLGARILHVFGVSLDAFSVAGGGVLVWIGTAMLTGRGAPAATDDKSGSDAAPAPSIVPLVLFAASPGTITGVITISVNHSKLDIPTTAITAICTVLAVTWVVLVLSTRMGGTQNRGGIVRDMVTRYMGLIVIAMGIQFMLTGFKAFMGFG